jgi:hypothetical protein
VKRTPLVTAPIRWVERSPLDWGGGISRRFSAPVEDGDLVVIVGREPIGLNRSIEWHLSISHSSRYPTWDEIADARERWLPDEITFGMILPPRAEYVNVHPTTFHLHEIRQ